MASTPSDGNGGVPAAKEGVPLSASATSFNPSASATPSDSGGAPSAAGADTYLSPSTLWGAIGQSYSGPGAGGSPQDEQATAGAGGSSTPGGASNVNNSNASTPATTKPASASAAGGAAGGGGTTQETLGGLWNFGGFDVDALTNENSGGGGAASAATSMMLGGGGQRQEDVSRLSSAFGNFGLQQGGLQQGPSHHQQGGGGHQGNRHQGNQRGGSPGGGGLYNNQSNRTHNPNQYGNKYGGAPQAQAAQVLGDDRNALGFMGGYNNDSSGYGNNRGSHNAGGGYGGPPSHHGGHRGNQYQGRSNYDANNSQNNYGNQGGGMAAVPGPPPLQPRVPHHEGNRDDSLSGPYPPSFPAGGTGGGNAPPHAAYHTGPGWDQLPRWGGGAAGQISYGAGSGGANTGGYGTGGMGGSTYGLGGGGAASGGRPSYPPYPMPPAEYQSGGGYDAYQGAGYQPGGYQGSGGGNTSGGERNIPGVMPPAAAQSYSGGRSQSGGAGSSVLSGPYPPSFQPSDSANNDSGAASGALSSILQTPYNPHQAAQQKYPPILGGTPDPASGAVGMDKMSSSGMLGSGGSVLGSGGSTAGSVASGSMAGSGSTSNLTSSLKVKGDQQSSSNLGDMSPTPSNLSGGAINSVTAVAGGAVAQGATAPSAGGPLSRVSSGAPLAPPAGAIPDNDAPILPQRMMPQPGDYDDNNNNNNNNNRRPTRYNGIPIPGAHDSQGKKREWLISMNAQRDATPVGQLDPNALPLSTIMNGWAKQKSGEGARQVEEWLERVHDEYNADNPSVHPTARMYTMAVDAWAKSNGGAPAARRAEALLERMDRLYREGNGRHEALKPTTGIFNAVINVSCFAAFFAWDSITCPGLTFVI